MCRAGDPVQGAPLHRGWVAGQGWNVFGTWLHVGWWVPTVLFVVVLAAVFATWFAVEKTLSIRSINTPRRELFYWAAVVSTFAMGTAAGDISAITLKLGYFASGLLFAALILVTAGAYRLLGLNAVVAFWFAYVLTRPVGASFAGWFGKPHGLGGIGVGSGLVSVLLAVLIAGFVAYLARTKIDTPDTRKHRSIIAPRAEA